MNTKNPPQILPPSQFTDLLTADNINDTNDDISKKLALWTYQNNKIRMHKLKKKKQINVIN